MSLNQLIPLNSNFQLRLNGSYTNDFQKQQSSFTTKYFLPSDTISINEHNKYHGNQNLLQTDLTLMANTPKYYFKDLLRLQGWWSTGNDLLNSSGNINQHLSNPFFNVSNDFRLLATKSKYIHAWSSYIGFVSLPQSLNIQPGLYSELLNNTNPYDNLVQQASLKTFFTDNYLSLRKKRSRWGSEYKIGFNIQKQKMISDLIIEESGIKMPAADTFHNNLDRLRYSLYEENNWSYETDKFRITFSLPLNYTRIDYENNLQGTHLGKEAFFINPSATIMIQVNPMWNINLSSSYTQNFSDITEIVNGYILKNYRNFSNNSSPLNKIKTFNGSASVTFGNPLKIIFFNTGVLYFRNQSGLLYSQEFNGDLQTLKAVLQNNYRDQVQGFGRFSKYVIDWKTSFGVNYSLSFGNSEQIQQNELVKFKNRNYQAGATINIKWSSAFTSEYNATYGQYFSRSQFQQMEYSTSFFNQRISLNYYPSKKWILGISGEHYYLNNISSPSLNYFFADGSIRYSPQKSRLDYEISLRNLVGTKNYTTNSLSNNVESVAEYRIRPREILIKIGFPF
ncbi:MAG: hypothetical protein JST17_12075 [Bacteroidetes bacterium]|nr:hypothetical protein [Bacteroidota bacterium]MBS1932183.1 hypothetical protein [Bacteroidota bacterium]